MKGHVVGSQLSVDTWGTRVIYHESDDFVDIDKIMNEFFHHNLCMPWLTFEGN
jgi:hypothetical protein